MAHSSSHEAIILRTIDVGEADRFCILFTKDAGRMTARAYGVRKPKSRMGGSILPFRHVTVQMRESAAGNTINAVSDTSGDRPVATGMFALLQMERGIELLLQLTEEGESLPQVFALLRDFTALSASDDADRLPAFQLRLLALLGLLPATSQDPRFARLSESARAYVVACGSIENFVLLYSLLPQENDIRIFLREVLQEHVQRPLKSEALMFSWTERIPKEGHPSDCRWQ